MTRYLKDYDNNFNTLKKITIVTLLGAFFSIGILTWYVLRQEEKKGKQIYVITDIGSFSALRKENRQVSIFEMRNQVKTFLHTMFAHHAGNYQEKVDAALHLIDKEGGQRIVNDFNKGEVYQNYVRLGTQTTIQVDSVLINMQDRPVSGKAYAQQSIYLGEKKKAFPIGIQFEMVETYRSDKNPYGLLIQNFDYILYAPNEAGERP
jgi:hypothetical protein